MHARKGTGSKVTGLKELGKVQSKKYNLMVRARLKSEEMGGRRWATPMARSFLS